MIQDNKQITLTRNTMSDFVSYHNKHPELRFWQALTNWSGAKVLLNGVDPYYWHGKNHN